jgi:nucleotide-binding universal stress UspA family protein
MNTKIERILFATDFLENSRLALDYAVSFAEHFDATIIMLHVFFLSQAAREVEVSLSGSSASRTAAEDRLNTLAEGVRRLGLKVEVHVVSGFASDVILESVKTYKADLLVLGTHGIHRGLDHLLIGSNTEKILLSANCPTLTVGAHVLAGFNLKNHLKEILYFSDFTPEATAAAPYALFLGKEFHVPVEIGQLLPVVAENNPQLQNQLAEVYCESLKRVIGDAEEDWCLPAFQLKRGMELDQMIERAETQNAGMIVLGVHSESYLGRHLHTSFAYQLLACATCPILTVRHRPIRSERESA